MPDLNKFPRKLEERSYLAIEFPQTDKRVFRTYVPFLENPKISEKGKSNLSEYNLLGRPGSLFSYGGSPSREISLSFKISLLNLLHLDSTEGISERFKRSFNLFFSDREMAKEAFNLTTGKSEFLTSNQGRSLSYAPGTLEISPGGDGPGLLPESSREDIIGSPDVKMGKGLEHSSIHRGYYRDLIGRVTGTSPSFDDFANILTTGINAIPGIFTGPNSGSIGSPQDTENRITGLLDMIYVWVNLIRSTTLNNSTNTVLGPPTVRLTHGPMYNNVPCVVEDYSIKIVDESGFEMQSLTPKQIEISLSLKENRVGDSGDFLTGTLGSGDNIVGWEAIIDSNNIDPYNGLINPNGKDYI